MMHRGKIPDRWIPYKACGDVIEGTRIICFKVPLRKNVQENVPGITKMKESDPVPPPARTFDWDIPAVLAEIPKLGAVIDLTNTARYYNPREFLAANVLHRKILMAGREIPPEDKVREFMDTVDEFLGKDCEALVGVHCTHGLNRTGYMVCRYMRDRLNIPAKDAIKRFEKARGYKLERQIYIAGLLNKKLPPPDFDSDWNVSQPRVTSSSEARDKNKFQSRSKNESQPSNKNESQSTSRKRRRKRNNKDEIKAIPKKRKIY